MTLDYHDYHCGQCRLFNTEHCMFRLLCFTDIVACDKFELKVK